MKTCTGCGEPKHLDDFYRHKLGAQGRAARCKGCEAARNSEYHRENREKLRATRAAWRAKNPNFKRLWEEENPHSRWATNYQRRARRYGFEAVVVPFSSDELIDRYGDACVHCGGPFEELDHYPVPVSRGGVHSLDNCVPSCRTCNRRAGVALRNATEEVNQR